MLIEKLKKYRCIYLMYNEYNLLDKVHRKIRIEYVYAPFKLTQKQPIKNFKVLILRFAKNRLLYCKSHNQRTTMIKLILHAIKKAYFTIGLNS